MSKTLQQFREWSIKAGSTGNPSGGSYHGECVSLIQQYLHQVFGIAYQARGHAAWFVPPTFKQLPANTKLKPGDIVRYGTNYGGGYGHIGMIDDRGQYLDQNGVVARRVGTRSHPFMDIRAVFRPTKKFTVKTPTKKKSNSQVADEIIAGKGGWGTGAVRIAKLTAKGYNAVAVQKLVNSKMTIKPKAKKVYVTVKKGWGISNVAKAAGFSDWHKTSRWSAIAKLNGSKSWNTYNKNLKPGQRVRVK